MKSISTFLILIVLCLCPAVLMAQSYGSAQNGQLAGKFFYDPSTSFFEMKIGHWGPRGILAIDWNTFQIEEDGVDVTTAFMAAVGTPVIASTVPRKTVIYFSSNSFFTGQTLKFSVCLSAVAGGACITTERLLRDASCAPSIGCTTGGAQMTSFAQPPGFNTYNMSPFYFNTPSTTVITSARGIGNAITPNWNAAWHIDIWKATTTQTVEQAFAANPTMGNHIGRLTLNQTHSTLSNGDFLVDFTPSNGPIVLPAGNYLISVSINASGAWYWRENASSGLGTDLYIDDTMTTPLPYFPTYATGVQAVDLIGYR